MTPRWRRACLRGRRSPPARDRVVPDVGAAASGTEEAGRDARAALAGVSRAAHPTGYAYSQFCERYRRWARALKPSMRQVHRAGEKLFVDFSGKRPHLVDRARPARRSAGRTLRRRARRERLDLRRGHAEPGSAVVGRRPRPHAGLLSGQSGDLGPGQFEERRHDGEPLRTGDQPHVRRPRPPLWRRGDSRARRARRPTNPKSKSVSRSPSGGSWRCCATAPSSRSPI